MELNGDVGQRQIGQGTLVVAMHATGRALAAGTDHSRSGCMNVNGHAFWQELSFAKFEQCPRGQEEWFEHGQVLRSSPGRANL